MMHINTFKLVVRAAPDDAELVEIASTAVGAEGLLEGDVDAGDVVTVPGGPKYHVTEPVVTGIVKFE